MSYTAFLYCFCCPAFVSCFLQLPVLSASAHLISKHHANFHNYIEIHTKKGLDSLLNQILFHMHFNYSAARRSLS